MANVKLLTGIICAVTIATAMPTAAQDHGETITPHFEKAIPNIPGKSLVALVVDYAPGGASPPAYSREISLRLRLCRVRRNRVAGE
jgi:hypothetical protein